MHTFMIELYQTIDIQEKKKKENLCTKSMESFMASQILADFRPERATYKTLHN